MNKKVRTPFSAISAIALVILTITNHFHSILPLSKPFIGIFESIKHMKSFSSSYITYLNIRFRSSPIRVVDLFLNLAVSIAIYVVLSIFLFKKKRDLALVAVIACQTFTKLGYLIQNTCNVIRYPAFFSIRDIIDDFIIFIAYAILTAFTFLFCEQTLIKADFSKFKKLVSKFCYLPAVMLVLSFVLTYILRLSTFSYRKLVWSIIEVITVLSLVIWLKDPYKKEKPIMEKANNINSLNTDEDAYCSLGKHILLLIFTCGIWYLIWVYRTTKYLNKTPESEYCNPTSKLLLFMFVPFYSIFWYYRHGQKIDSFSKSKGLNNSDIGTLCLILGIFIPIVACILIQDKINTLCLNKSFTATCHSSQFNEIKKYKELLDSGIITQEEFDAKKKQLLDL